MLGWICVKHFTLNLDTSLIAHIVCLSIHGKKKGAIRVRKGGHQYFSSFKMLRDYVSSSRLYWHNRWYFKWHLYIVIERLICDLDGVRIRNLGYERGSQHNFQGIPETYKRTSQTVDFKTYVSNGWWYQPNILEAIQTRSTRRWIMSKVYGLDVGMYIDVYRFHVESRLECTTSTLLILQHMHFSLTYLIFW